MRARVQSFHLEIRPHVKRPVRRLPSFGMASTVRRDPLSTVRRVPLAHAWLTRSRSDLARADDGGLPDDVHAEDVEAVIRPREEVGEEGQLH